MSHQEKRGERKRRRLLQKKREIPEWVYQDKYISTALDATQLEDRFEEVSEMFKLGQDDDLKWFLEHWMPTMKWTVKPLLNTGDETYDNTHVLFLEYTMNGTVYRHYEIRKQ